MTHRVLLEVPDDVYGLLSEAAEQTKQPLEELAVQWLAKVGRDITNDPMEKYIGAFATNVPDWGERHDELLGEALLDDHRDPE
ncbi:MAG: hypothetical protein M3437_16065 [Chloroflexota bacterium]|nr:hypothetical protein [Chloroflexota bacterium]MDQ5867803.1 hypothetical protein [Chloroflexota bacterium]